MAKQIEDIIVKLGLQGFEGLDKIRSSFRDLSKVTKMSEQDIIGVRDSIFEFAKTAGNSEAVTKGLVSALQGLRSQADFCGDAYRSLADDIRRVGEVQRGATDALMAQRNALVATFSETTRNVRVLEEHRAALVRIQEQTRANSRAYDTLSSDIAQIAERITEVTNVARELNVALSRGFPATAAGVRATLTSINAGIELQRQVINEIDLRSGKERKLSSTVQERALAEQQLNRALIAQRQLTFGENVRSRREAVRTAAAAFNETTLTTGFYSAERIGQRMGDLPNTTAGLNQELSELSERLVNTYIGTQNYINVATRMAAIQRQVRDSTLGVASAFVAQLRSGEIAPSLANVREVLTSVQAEQALVNTNTAEGAREFALAERRARQLERQLDALRTAQQNLASTPLSGFREFSQSITPQEGDAAVQGSIRRNRQRQERERRRLEREAADFYSSQPTAPLLLPAAGQTTSTGRGMARRRLRMIEEEGSNFGTYGPGVETVFGESTLRRPRARAFMGLPALPEAETGLPSRLGTSPQAMEAQRATAARTATDLSAYRRAIREAAAANIGSVNSLNAYKDALENMRSAIAPTNADFGRLTKRIEAVDTQIEKLNLRTTRRKPLSGMQLAQGVGAALSGGIFGGPEGLLGGLGGLAVGGVGGAFAGAAFGAQVGMFRQQLGAVTDYSARIDKLQIALRGIVGSQDAYSQALAAAASVTRDLNIPQESAIQGMTRLSAAVQGAGGTVSDSAFAFRAVSEAVKATGGNAEQADGALLALTQVFSKGKVSAEELNQIAERLPGTFTLFAKAAGKSGPELQKALQQGEVGLNDLMKFLQLISGEYGQTALKIAASSQEAGARLSVAMKNMQLEVGRALQPIGASLQSAFADFTTETTPAAVAAIRAIGSAFSYLTIDPVGKELAKLTLHVGAATASVLLFVPAVKALGLALVFTGTKAKELLILLAKNPLTLLAIAGTAAAIKVADAVLEQKRLNDEVERSLAIAAKAPSASVAAQINSTEDALRAARTKYAADLEKLRAAARTPFVFENVASPDVKEIDRLEAKLRKLETVYKARVELETIFKGLDPQAGVPTGYKLVNGRLAYLSPGQGYIDAETGKPVSGGLTTFAGGSKDDQAKLGASYLQAFEQREEAIAQARVQREEQIADIRKQALEQARQLERQFADERRALERDIEKSKRGAADIEEDIARQRRLLAGEDPRLIEAEQRIVDAYREARDRDIDIKEQYADREFNRARTLSDFQKKTADDINKANETYAKSLGKIHREYAKDVSKMLDEASGKTARRLAKAGQVLAAISELQALQMTRVRLGQTPVPADVDMPIQYRQQLDKINTLNKELLQSRRQAPSTADRFFTAYAGGGDFNTDKLARNLGNVVTRQLQGVLAQVTDQLIAGVPYREGDTIGAAAQRSNARPLTVVPATKGVDKASEDARAAAAAASAAELRRQLLTISIDALAPLEEQNRRLQEQNDLFQAQQRYIKQGVTPALAEQYTQIDQIGELSRKLAARQAAIAIDKALTDGANNEAVLELVRNHRNLTTTIDANVNSAKNLASAYQDAQKAARFTQDDRIGLGLREGAEQYVQSIGTMREATAQLAQTGIKGVEDAIFSLVTTGTANFKEFAASILKDTARMIIQQMILRSVMQIIGAVGGGGASAIVPGKAFDPSTVPGMAFAKGAAFAANGIVPFAMGGLVDRPTLFKFANGGAGRLGLMGEAGPEAIMPLRRLPSGRLGVEAAGGNNSAPVNVTVNVDANGTSVQGDAGQGEQLGRVISQAVQAELVRQKRPGGLLAA